MSGGGGGERGGEGGLVLKQSDPLDKEVVLEVLFLLVLVDQYNPMSQPKLNEINRQIIGFGCQPYRGLSEV